MLGPSWPRVADPPLHARHPAVLALMRRRMPEERRGVPGERGPAHMRFLLTSFVDAVLGGRKIVPSDRACDQGKGLDLICFFDLILT